MIVNREKMEAALEAHVRRVRDTGHATQVETDLYDALKSAIENGVPEPAPKPTWVERMLTIRDGLADGKYLTPHEQRSLMDRLVEVEAMVEEVAALCTDEGSRPHTWTADDVVRNEDGAIVTIFGTLERWEEIPAGELLRESAWDNAEAEPYIVGNVQ